MEDGGPVQPRAPKPKKISFLLVLAAIATFIMAAAMIAGSGQIPHP